MKKLERNVPTTKLGVMYMEMDVREKDILVQTPFIMPMRQELMHHRLVVGVTEELEVSKLFFRSFIMGFSTK